MRAIAGFALSFSLLAAVAAAQDAPHELYRNLNDLRVDSHRVYYVRDLHLRRDVVSLTFSEGKLAFLEPLNERVTGAVFAGAGHVIAIPREQAERASLARFLGAPLLDQHFSRAYLRFTDDTAEELGRTLRRTNAEPTDDPSFAADWDPTVADLAPAHSVRVMADWLSIHPRPYFYAGLVGTATGPFDVLVDHRRDEQVLVGQPVWSGCARFYDVWTSFRAPNSEGQPFDPFLPLDYAIETTIQPDLSLKGKTTIHLRAAGNGERMVPLELSRMLTVQSVTDAAGRPLAFFQNEELNRQEITRRGNDSLFLVLPNAPGAGAELRLQLAYRGSVITDAGNGVSFVGARGSWYPHISGAGRFAAFDLTFRWPRKLQLVATGQPLDQRAEGEWRVGRWRSSAPITVAGFNLGEFSSAEVDAGGTKIELYANQQLEQELLNRFRREVDPTTLLRPPPEWAPRRRSPPPVLPSLPPPSPAAVLRQLGQDIGNCIRFYEKLLGPFPFERLKVSQIPGSFGQGWPGLLYLSTLAFLARGEAQRVGLRSGTAREFSELVPYHEVAHQWWGNMVSWSSYRDQWIEEALANYLALVYADSKKPSEHLLAGWLERYRNELTVKVPGKNETRADAGPLVFGYRLNSSKWPEGYNSVVYGKGSWVFHTLRMMLRDPAAKDPDARFWNLLRSLVEDYRYRALTTDDLEHAVEKQMTPEMDLEDSHSMAWFFDQWVRDTGIPRYSVSFDVRPRGNGFVVRGTLKQADVPETFLATVPVYAVGASSKPVLLGKVVTSGAETPFEFTTRFRPKRLVIDLRLVLLHRVN